MKTNSIENGTRRAATSLALVCLALGLAVPGVRAQLAEAPALFDLPAMAFAAVPFAGPDGTVLRSRSLVVNTQLFTTLAAGQSRRIRFPLFADREYIGILTEVENTGSSFHLWRGQLEGYVNGKFHAVYRDDVLFMRISDGRGGEFDIRSMPGGGYRVAEPFPGVQGVCGTDEPLAFAPAAGKAAAKAASASTTIIDILILYTPNARAAAGGPEHMQAKAEELVFLANSKHDRSLTKVNFRLVGLEEVAYDDSGQNIHSHLTALRACSSGPLSIACTRQVELGADLVCLLVNGLANSDALGISDLPGTYSVVEWSQDPNVFTHETAHNLGCMHERGAHDVPANDPGYNHGFFHIESWDLGPLGIQMERRDTIMSSIFYPAQRTDYFSNPNISFTFTGLENDFVCADVNRPLGDASANNAAFLNEERANIAVRRQARFYMDAANTNSFAWATQYDPVGNRPPFNDLPRIFSAWFPATEVTTNTPASIRMAAGNYPAIRITQNARLEKWRGSGNVRLGP